MRGPEITRLCMDMRATLDKEGARRLLAQAPRPDFTALRESHGDLLNRAKMNMTRLLPPEALRVDLSLHDTLASGLENPLLKQCYEENRNRISIVQNSRPFLQDRIVPAMEEHLQIIDASSRRIRRARWRRLITTSSRRCAGGAYNRPTPKAQECPPLRSGSPQSWPVGDRPRQAS